MVVRRDGLGLAALLLTLGLAHAGESSLPANPFLHADTEVATAGYYGLSWGLPGSRTGDLPGDPTAASAGAASDAPHFELEEAAGPAFDTPRILYAGPDLATALSGRPDGIYYYRVRADGGPWSPPVAVTVAHHTLTRAWLFFALGATVFAATAVLILRGGQGRPKGYQGESRGEHRGGRRS